jgi:putative ABC transport system permease protein
MDTLLHDLRYAFRGLRRSPGFALVAVLTLALGIGANTAIFSVVNTALLRPLPYPEPDRLVRVYSGRNGENTWTVSPPDFVDWRAQAGVFAHTAALNSGADYTITGAGGAERVAAAQVTPDFFDVLGVPPALGRGFTQDNAQVGQDKVAVLSYGLWQQRFGGQPDIVGQTIQLDGVTYAIAGVMPKGFAYPAEARLWTPLAFSAHDLATQRGAHYLDVIARLKPGVTLTQAQSAMQGVAARLSQQYPKTNDKWSANVATLRDSLVGDVRPALLILLGAVGLVLLIACANVANLLLARAMGRERELAIRTALGAGRGAIVRGILTESLLLAILGGIAGLLVAVWGTHALITLQPDAVSGMGPVGVDATVLGFTLVLTLLTGVLFGLIPALHASRVANLSGRLKEGSRGATGSREWWRARSLLVTAEMAFAVILLAGAGLLMKSFVRLIDTDPGFRTEHVLTFNLSLPDARYQTPEQSDAFYTQFLEQVRSLPGVQDASAIFGLPLTGFGYQISVHELDGRVLSSREEDELPSPQVRIVTPDYFQVLGIPVLRGRSITDADRAGAPPVVVVNETAAKLYWPGESAVGHHFTIGTDMGVSPDRVGGTVVGVVADTKDNGPSVVPKPQMYLSHSQVPVTFMSIAVRTASVDENALVSAIRSRLHDIDPNIPMYQVSTMQQLLGDSVAQPRFYMLLLGVFAGAALLLAAVGIYGVMAYVVGQRTHEIGVRMALGARGPQVLRQIVGRGMRPAMAGVALGLAGSIAITRVLSDLLYGVSATDPLTFIGVAVVLVAVSLAATLVPARRATTVDPVIALRAE